ncbi:S8 family serine peptidase [Corynebacterium sp. 320]|nr:S8 family serine peptidase [Corynebacterium sp. 320]KAB1552636.1 S8 family serine peptidase [Corynebacterium sp. 321]KAB1554146.1 S8 family serine peptidase [Corynebacterium sp. 319]KAB3528400.1 S8 family serine peptidase [Corynebacterium sp. 250]KAB3540110.1 S8 family serine peptidase [Corynebacterium sp. 366]
MSNTCQEGLIGPEIPVDHSATETTPGSGHDVPIAVIDTGSAAPGVSGDRDFCILHGSAVASVIQQVAPGAPIASFLHSDSPERSEGTVSHLVAAIDAALAEPHPARIINISMVACQDTVELREAITRAQSTGALVVASTGNTGQCEEDQVPYPASLPGVLAVGAVDARDSADHVSDSGRIPADYSAAGPWAMLYASGGPVSARVERDPEKEPGVVTTFVGSPDPFIGTSFATPVVSGTAARVWEILPQATADTVTAILLATASPGGAAPGMQQPIKVVDTQAAINASLQLREQHRTADTSGVDAHAVPQAYGPVQPLPPTVTDVAFTPEATSYIVPVSLAVLLSLVFIAVTVCRAVVPLSRPASVSPAMVRHGTPTGSLKPKADNSSEVPTE